MLEEATMRTMVGWFVAVLAVVVLAAPETAQAQGRGRGFGGGFGGGGGYMLLRNKGVQQELKLNDEQTEKVTKLAEEIGTKTREKSEGLSKDERREKMPEIMRAANEEARKAAKEILKPEQLARFEQIELQQRGLTAFADPKVQDKLSLTADQKTKIREIGTSNREQMTEIFQNAGNDRAAAMEKMTALRKESLEKALGVLTDDQKKSWKDLTGEPFEVRFEGRRPGAGN